MKVKILSNVVCDPLSAELKKIIPFAKLSTEYHEDLIVKLNSSTSLHFADSEYIFIHCDYYFHRVVPLMNREVLESIYSFASKSKSLIIVSNSFINGYSDGPVWGSPGKHLNVLFFENDLIRKILSLNNIVFFDYQSIIFEIGFKNAFNYNLGHLYQMPYTKKMLVLFAERLANFLLFYKTPEKKVIVVDCDNTLWGGVIGEDGIDGVKCNTNSDGILYHQFQKFLRIKKEEGFLLCICSKNNFNDVYEVFNKKEMPLRWEDFIIKKINWRDKHVNITEIANELNLGLESLVFIDDNDFELNAVMQMLNVVKSLKFDSDYSSFLTLMENNVFKRKLLTTEDLQKTKQYEDELLRKEEMSNSSSIDEYIANLNIKLDIRKNDINDFVRLSQMTEKTNQFNFNKKVYSVNELSSFVRDCKGYIYSLKVSDKHGDYGTVGLIITEFSGDDVVIENFLMSCRVLGRRIESSFFSFVIDDLSKENKRIKDVRFIKTPKNNPAEEFFKTIKL